MSLSIVSVALLAISSLQFKESGYPPVFLQNHAGGRITAVADPTNDDQLAYGPVVYNPADHDSDELDFGPELKLAFRDGHKLVVLDANRRRQEWDLPRAKIFGWWDLPLITGARVSILKPEGGLATMPIPGFGLVTVVPARSGDFYALLAFTSRWRIMRNIKGISELLPWHEGKVTDFTICQDRLYVLTGEPFTDYVDHGIRGPGDLWSFKFHDGSTKKVLHIQKDSWAQFDDRWVQSRHVLSLQDRPSKRGFATRTRIFELSAEFKQIANLASGWAVYGLSNSGKALALHIDRGEMGFDLCELNLKTGNSKIIDENIDAVFPSTGKYYSPFVSQ
jgi:hypothetical protein